MKKTLFLILSGAIVIFSIICICTAPIINKIVNGSSSWNTANCQKLSDDYERETDVFKKSFEKISLKECRNRKAMYGLEHSTLILDVILGFVCLILGLLHYFDIAKPFEKITGIIGLSTGIIEFILTMIYLGYSSYIFTNGFVTTDDQDIPLLFKRNEDWKLAELSDENYYKCLFYEAGEFSSFFATYSDLGKKQYNYNKEKYQANSDSDSEFANCQVKDQLADIDNIAPCFVLGYTYGPATYSSNTKTYKNLYARYNNSFENKYVFDRWVTTIIFSCFIIVCDIGLAIFGFLLFKSSTPGL